MGILVVVLNKGVQSGFSALGTRVILIASLVFEILNRLRDIYGFENFSYPHKKGLISEGFRLKMVL